MIDRLNSAVDGRYRIERELGEGGMATVYLAHDLKHDRQVALKLLKPELAAVVGADRFLTEIKVTANLQHPHILPLYDSGEAGSFLYYAMPYVEGESLRERLDREKQLPVEEAIAIATAVAEALDYAHRHGVVHRDIKPANILLQDGQPVVADFGIALAVGAAGGARLTETGLSVGTPYYMSPEQATGDREVGPASDTYSLACVLHEMLTGDPPYQGSTAQAVLGQIIAGDPKPASERRPSVPPHVDSALLRALQKIPADRFPTAHEFARALADPAFRYGGAATAAAGAGRSSGWTSLTTVFAVAALVLLLVAGTTVLRPAPDGAVTRVMVGLDEEESLWYTGLWNPPRVSISPDGSRFVYVGLAGPRESALWLRRLDQLSGQRLMGTEGAVSPAIAPDGERVAFLGPSTGAHRSLQVTSLSGGAPILVVPSGVSSGPVWGPGGYIYYVAGDRRTLVRIQGSGGTPDTVTTLDLDARYGAYALDAILDDGAAIVTAVPQSSASSGRGRSQGSQAVASPDVHVVRLPEGTSTARAAGSGGRVTPTGRFTYMTGDGTMMGQAFDRRALAPEGNPVPLVWGVDVRNDGIVDVAVSGSGTLLYILENTQAPERWVWVDPSARTEPLDPDWTEDQEFEGLSLSPDGTRLAVEMQKETFGRFDIWIKPVGPGAPSRLTFRGAENRRPAWSPDGEWVAFLTVSTEGQDAWRRRADGSGSAEPLLDHERDIVDLHWPRSGNRILVVLGGPTFDIAAAPATGDGEVVMVRDGPYDETEPALSPDGRWLAYTSDETGREEVFVVPFPNVDDGKWQISTQGGREPRWSRDGDRLYVRHGDGSGLDVVDMSAGPITARVRTLFDVPPEDYFELNPTNHMYEVGPDGRVLMLEAGRGDTSGALVMVQNWFVDVERRLAEGR